ncbi:dephospho-CoA kinase [Pelagibacterales bacterium SAG-MED37]|nr:dephospho-CoA kinase [Pelagibacterales bacterium SAG-MED37]
MIKIGILGDIGSGKSYIAKNFGYPVFNADKEVGKLYKSNKRIFIKLKKVLPKFIYSFPINKNEIINAIFANQINLKKITKVIHSEIRKEMNKFLKRHISKKIVILDIPLLLENKINKKGYILVFVKSNKKAILKKLKKRPGFNYKLFTKFKKIQLPLDYKMKKSHFIIRNNFTKKSVKRDIEYILKKIL